MHQDFFPLILTSQAHFSPRLQIQILQKLLAAQRRKLETASFIIKATKDVVIRGYGNHQKVCNILLVLIQIRLRGSLNQLCTDQQVIKQNRILTKADNSFWLIYSG